MFDFYKLPRDTPGMDKIGTIRDPYKQVLLLETEIQAFEKYLRMYIFHIYNYMSLKV